MLSSKKLKNEICEKYGIDVHKPLLSCEIAIVVVWQIANREHMTKQN